MNYENALFNQKIAYLQQNHSASGQFVDLAHCMCCGRSTLVIISINNNITKSHFIFILYRYPSANLAKGN